MQIFHGDQLEKRVTQILKEKEQQISGSFLC